MRLEDRPGRSVRAWSVSRQLATAEETEALRAKEEALAAKLSGLNLADALKSADPQSEALARLTGVAPSTVKDALAILVAVLIELGSGFGLYAATAGHVVQDAPKTTRPKNQDHPTAVDDPAAGRAFVLAHEDRPTAPRKTGRLLDPVRQFSKAALRPAPDKAVAAADLHSAFVRWAASEGCEPLSPAALGRRLTKMNFKRVKKGGTAYYCGFELSPGALLN
jgi:hypothetical protein